MLAKKKLLIFIGGALVLILVAAGFFVSQKKQGEVVSPLSLKTTPETAKQEDSGRIVSYKDEAGFEFNYPEKLTVKDVSGDLPVYSSLEIFSNQREGEMVIKIADTPFSSVDAWLKSKEASDAGSSREITLAGRSGKQIQFENPRRLVTIVINEGIMYFLESPLDEAGLWNKIHNDIVSSFTLSDQTPASQVVGEEVIYEEEEIIE